MGLTYLVAWHPNAKLLHFKIKKITYKIFLIGVNLPIQPIINKTLCNNVLHNYVNWVLEFLQICFFL